MQGVARDADLVEARRVKILTSYEDEDLLLSDEILYEHHTPGASTDTVPRHAARAQYAPDARVIQRRALPYAYVLLTVITGRSYAISDVPEILLCLLDLCAQVVGACGGVSAGLWVLQGHEIPGQLPLVLHQLGGNTSRNGQMPRRQSLGKDSRFGPLNVVERLRDLKRPRDLCSFRVFRSRLAQIDHEVLIGTIFRLQHGDL